MVLNGLMFYRVISLTFTFTVACVRSKESFRPRISNYIVMHVVVKGDVFEFIGRVITKNGILLCELRQ